jgi:hypothetical protein
MIAALFVETGGVYFGLSEVDPWDERRDAMKYDGNSPAVLHPPCQRWSRLNRVYKKRYGYVMGDDGGCFAFALATLRRVGGVLEHPAESLAFAAFGLPRPRSGSWQSNGPEEWVTEVKQAAYGHRATKRTWLVYHGRTVPPDLDWRAVRGTHQIGGFDVTLPQLPKKERSRTPVLFRDLLIRLAGISR